MTTIPGFTAEQSLRNSAFPYRHRGGRRSSAWGRLHPMQESSNYDTGDDTETDPGDNTPPDDNPDDNPLASNYDAGVQMCRCNVCKRCQYQYGQYTCTGGFVVTAVPCGSKCGNTPCDQGVAQ